MAIVTSLKDGGLGKYCYNDLNDFACANDEFRMRARATAHSSTGAEMLEDYSML